MQWHPDIVIAWELEVNGAWLHTSKVSIFPRFLPSIVHALTLDRADDDWASGCPDSQTSIPTYEWWNGQTSSLSWTLWARISTTFATTAFHETKNQHTFEVL